MSAPVRSGSQTSYSPTARGRACPTFGGTCSGGLRGSKWSLYEAGIRLPHADGSRVELYAVVADRAEKLDLVAVKPELAKRLAESALRWHLALPTAN